MTVCEVLRLFVSLFYGFCGFAAFVTFLIIVNYPASIWGFLTAACNGILIHLHLLKMRNILQVWYDNAELDCSGRFGFAFFTLGCAGLTFHIVKELMLKTPILPVGNSEVIPAVWCLMTLKSGLILMYYAKYYQETETENEALVSDASEGTP